MRIHGITIKYIPQVKGDADGFGKEEVVDGTPENVEDVLVAPTTSDDLVTTTDLEGKHIVYTMAIPKGDTHVWNEAVVEFFGERWKCFEIPTQGIEANIPLSWNKKVVVERYE